MDSSEIDKLIWERMAAKQQLRNVEDRLREAGVSWEDSEQGTRWWRDIPKTLWAACSCRIIGA